MSTHDEPQPGTAGPGPDEPRPGGTPADPPPAWGTPAGGPGPGTAGPSPAGAPNPSGTPGPTGADGFFDRIRRGGLTRSDDRWVGGVAGGFAERFGLDPLLVRGILVLSFFLTGVGLVLYALGWALLPERRDGRIHLQEAFRGNFDVAMVGAVAAFLIGVAWGGPWSWWDDAGVGWLSTLFWLAAIGLAVYLVVQRSGRRRTPPSGAVPSGAAPSGPVPPGPAPATGPVAPADGSEPYPPSGVGHAGVHAGVVAPYPPAPGTPPVPAPPVAPRPPKERSGGAGVVFGLILLAGALLLLQNRTSDLFPGLLGADMPFWPTWLGVSVVILGLGIVVAGLRGRSGGGLTAWAIVALVFGTPWLWWEQEGPDVAVENLVPRPAAGAQLITDGTISVGSIGEAERGFEVRFGDAEIDLSELDLSDVTPGDPVVVPITMNVGDATVVVPEGVAVEADANVGAGTVHWQVDDEDRQVSDVGASSIHLASDEVGDAGAVLLLDIQVGAGDITIEEN